MYLSPWLQVVGVVIVEGLVGINSAKKFRNGMIVPVFVQFETL